MKLRIGTRGSELARTQSGTIAAALGAAGHEAELVIIRTAGDEAQTAPFASIGPQGVFVREIEQALARGDIDLAVHSCKDLPTVSPSELRIGAVPERADPADVLIVRAGAAPADAATADWLPLPAGAAVGTASARRRAWLHHYRPDLDVGPLRGNVPTRIRRLSNGDFDAILLAAAGLERLGAASGVLEPLLEGLVVHRLDPRRFVPAPAQGALAVQCRGGDEPVEAALRALDDAASRIAVDAERDALARAEGGCDVAFGAHCVGDAARGYVLHAMLERDGAVRVAEAAGADPAALGAEAWRQLSGGA